MIETKRRCLIIGDVHGHYDRLEALLEQEGIVGPCPKCGGQDERSWSVEALEVCERCDGEGMVRLDTDSLVIQLGDLGHFGSNYDGSAKSPTSDRMCWEVARRGEKVDPWIDYVLWGNHDIAVFEKRHVFGGFRFPPDETIEVMREIRREGRLLFAFYAHKFLITHAGLHSDITEPHEVLKPPHILYSQSPWRIDLSKWPKYSFEVPKRAQERAIDFARFINRYPLSDIVRMRDEISYTRGGADASGGILWRDESEDLYPRFKQVFGHSKKEQVNKHKAAKGSSYCIDVGGPWNGRLAGIWLPDEKIVEVNLPKSDPLPNTTGIVTLDRKQND